jgi:hypothetical protein
MPNAPTGNPYKQQMRGAAQQMPTGTSAGNGFNAFALPPEELERMLAEGWAMGDDGMLTPPPMPMMGQMGQMPDYFPANPPSAGAMTAVDANPFASPVFGTYNAVANPPPVEKDPLKQLMRGPKEEKPPAPGMNVSVPGGASIANGMPTAAPLATANYQGQDAKPPTRNPYAGRVGRRMAERETTRTRR